jgi:hypothetical protein
MPPVLGEEDDIAAHRLIGQTGYHDHFTVLEGVCHGALVHIEHTREKGEDKNYPDKGEHDRVCPFEQLTGKIDLLFLQAAVFCLHIAVSLNK